MAGATVDPGTRHVRKVGGECSTMIPVHLQVVSPELPMLFMAIGMTRGQNQETGHSNVVICRKLQLA